MMQSTRTFLSVWILAGALFAAGLPAVALAQQQGAGEDKPTIAVWDFALNRMEEANGTAVTNRLRSELVNSRRFRVMTRDQIKTLLGEQALGQTLIDAKEAIKTGKLRGVKYVVTGTLISLRGAMQVTAEIIDGETAEIIQSITPRTYRGSFLDFLDEEVPELANRLVGVASGGQLAKQQTAAPPPPEPVAEEPPPRPAPATTSGPRLGSGLYAGYGTFSGSLDDGTGYSSSGLLLGVDYQIPLGSALSLNLLYMLSFEGFAGDVDTGGQDSGLANHQILAAQARVWLGPIFVGGHGGLYLANLTTGDFGSFGASGFGFGGVVGLETGGIIVTGQMDLGFLTSDDGSTGVVLFGLSANLGVRL